MMAWPDRDDEGSGRALILRPNFALGAQAKRPYLAKEEIPFEYETTELDEATCLEPSSLWTSLMARTEEVKSPEWRKANADDGMRTCNRQTSISMLQSSWLQLMDFPHR
jgi:hypothetical protein